MKTCILGLLGFLLAVLPARGQSIRSRDITLKNGLQVVVVEDHTVPSVCLAMAFHVGSRNELQGATGVSHLFEHMMFNGSARYKPGEFDRILEAGGGYSNAYTSYDITFYYEEFNPDLLDKVLDMEADRMRSLKIDTENLEQERGIVKEERRVSTDNSVAGTMQEQLYACAFLAHPYQHPVVGWMKDLDNITVDDAKAYFRTYYAPNNATMIIVGDVDPARVFSAAEKLFSRIPRQPVPRPVVDAEPEQRGERRIMLHKAAELPAVMVGYHGVPAPSDDYPALSLLATILSRGESSRLYTRLVHEDQVCTGASVGVDELLDPGLITFYAQMQPGYGVEKAEAAINEIIADVIADGVTDHELQKSRNAMYKDLLDDLKTNHGVAGRLGISQVIYGDFRKATSLLQRYDGVTTDDIRRVARKYLDPLHRTVVVLVPVKNPGENNAP